MHITPDQLVGVATAWMGAITAIVIGAIVAYGRIKEALGSLQSQHDATATRLDNTVNAVEAVKSQQVAIALAVPAPSQAIATTTVSTPVEAAGPKANG